MDQGKPQQDEIPGHGTRLVTEQRVESGELTASDSHASEENSKQLLTVTQKGL